MVVQYPRTVWKNSYAEHEVTLEHTIKKKKEDGFLGISLDNTTCNIQLYIKYKVVRPLSIVTSHIFVYLHVRENMITVNMFFLLDFMNVNN